MPDRIPVVATASEGHDDDDDDDAQSLPLYDELPLSVAGNVRWVATLQGYFDEVEHGWVGTTGSIGRFTTGPECFIIKWADQNQVDRVIGISSGSYVGRDAHGFSMERIQAKRTRACLWWNRH